jgi:hypothetical protein
LSFAFELRRLLLMPKIITAAERAARRKIGLGSAIKAVTTALGIKPCGGCKRRAVALDAIIPNINPLAKD